MQGPRVLLLTPPLSQLNTPYPATTRLTAFLRAEGYDCRQGDLSIQLALKLFSHPGLTAVRKELEKGYPTVAARKRAPASVRFFLEAFDDYLRAVEPAVRFLQGHDQALAHRISARTLLPQGPLFCAALDQIDAARAGGFDPLSHAFGRLGVQDQAKYFATLFIDDIAAVIRDGIDPRFGLSRYGEKLAASQASFTPLLSALECQQPTLIDRMIDELAADVVRDHDPDVLGLTAPFPGNVYAAFRMAAAAKRVKPGLTVIFGGGYANTELRELSDPRVFDFVDYIPLDDGEAPVLAILRQYTSLEPQPLLRTFRRVEGQVVFESSATLHDIPSKDLPPPIYDGLPLDSYLSLTEVLNPMHRLWSEACWLKLTVAHGCYWKKCSFCDTSLDYIGRYEPTPAARIVDAMEVLMKETGRSGFHFVDEAAPPAALTAVAEEILKRRLAVSWWGNVRFEKAFTPELCQKLADSGCIALTGGLEVADDRLLKLINKGVTFAQVEAVTRAMSEAGILVHAYLMYGFPTETAEETISALERVRKLFADGNLQSGFWHRFSATVHSPIGQDPAKYRIRIVEQPLSGPRFARNDLPFEDLSGVDHDQFTEGLNRALYNYMNGLGLDEDVRAWLA